MSFWYLESFFMISRIGTRSKWVFTSPCLEYEMSVTMRSYFAYFVERENLQQGVFGRGHRGVHRTGAVHDDDAVRDGLRVALLASRGSSAGSTR